jgi:hypothetical protein
MSRHAAPAALLLVALLYLATLLWLPGEGLWIVDNGNKLIQVEALLASGQRDYAIPWPGRQLDPHFELNPLPNLFSVVHEGRLYSVFSPAFPALASPLYAWLGTPGLYVLPFVSGVALLAGLLALARAAGLREPAGAVSVLVAGLCTPVWFYSVVFWEHIVAASLVVWAVAGWLSFHATRSPRALLASGAACAAAVWFRDQLLLLAALMGLMALAGAPGARRRAVLLFGAGLAAGLAPLALFQWLALGNPIGFHLTHGFQATGGGSPGARIAAHLADRPAALHHLFLAWAGDVPLSALLSLPLFALLLLRPALPRRAFEAALLGCALWGLAGALVTALGTALAASPIDWWLRSNGFFSAAPLLALGLVRRRDHEQPPGLRRLGQLVAAYAALYVLLSPLRNVAGIHWGSRYLLELYPLLAVPCAFNLLDAARLLSRARLAPLALLLVASTALQLQALDILERKKSFGQRLARAVRERPEPVIVTDEWWLPQTLATEFFQRPIFYVQSEEQARRLLGRLARFGERRFLFVTSSLDRPIEPGAVVVDDAGLRFFSQQLVPRSVSGQSM